MTSRVLDVLTSYGYDCTLHEQGCGSPLILAI